MNESQVLEQLSKTDAYAPETEMPASAWSRETARSEIERRMGMKPRKPTDQATTTGAQTLGEKPLPAAEPDSPSDTPRELTWRLGRRRPLIGAAAFLLALIVGAVILVAITGDESPPVAATTVVESGEPGITFDGTTCTYQGPTEFVLGAERLFPVINNSDVRLEMVVFRTDQTVAGFSAQLIEAYPIDQLPQPGLFFGSQVPPGNEILMKVSPGTPVPDEAGTWIVACTSVFGDTPGFQRLGTVFQVATG